MTTEWPVKGTATSWAPGIRAATPAASSTRGAQVEAAREDERGHGRQRRRRRRRRAGVRPRDADRDRLAAQRDLVVEGLVVGGRVRPGGGHGLAGALLGAGGAVPREGATPRSAWRRRARRSRTRRGRPASRASGMPVRPLARSSRRSSGRLSSRIALRIAPGSSERSVGFRSPASRMSSTPSWSRVTVRLLPPGVLTLPLIVLRPTLCTRLNRSWPTLVVMPLHAPLPHSSPSARGMVLKVEMLRTSEPSGGTTESSTSDSTLAGYLAA